MSLEYSLEIGPFDPHRIEAVAELSESVFGTAKADLGWRLERMPTASLACAREAQRLVGFKLGYALGEKRYYSWLGGVHADFRRRGIASELMRRQHSWLRERGFDVVETCTNQDNVPMIQANLQHGFVICGLRHKSKRMQVLFSRALG